MNHTILIIEDDQINCLVYRQIFKTTEVNLVFAHDGEDGVNKFKEGNYNLVLLDLRLPKIDGLTVASLIREWEDRMMRFETPIIVVTADNSNETRKKALLLGIDEFLVKPFEFESFLKIVNDYLSNPVKN